MQSAKTYLDIIPLQHLRKSEGERQGWAQLEPCEDAHVLTGRSKVFRTRANCKVCERNCLAEKRYKEPLRKEKRAFEQSAVQARKNSELDAKGAGLSLSRQPFYTL